MRVPSDCDCDALRYHTHVNQLARNRPALSNPDFVSGLEPSTFALSLSMHEAFERDQAADDGLLPPHELQVIHG